MGAVVPVAGFTARALLGLVPDPQWLAFSAATLVVGHQNCTSYAVSQAAEQNMPDPHASVSW